MGSNSVEEGSAEEQFPEGEVGHYDPEAVSNDGALERVKERYQHVLEFQVRMIHSGTDKPARMNHRSSIRNTETCC
jgi:hypothetical protein